MMKNVYSRIALLFLAGAAVLAPRAGFSQAPGSGVGLPPAVDPSAEMAPGVDPANSHSEHTPFALWDIQFNYNNRDSAVPASNGHAGAVWIDGEFWVSKWGSDTLYRFAQDGSWLETFQIGGVTGVRAMTWDGTTIYAAVNTSTIHKINPVTKAVIGTITAPITQVRFIAYDSTLASGAGGFYIGNFNTDITVMSMTGATLGTIAAATHTLTGMYGAAFDNYSSGGPYLWVFAQSGTPSNSMLHRLQLPSGVPTGISHDVAADVGAGVSGALAGGCFVGYDIVSGMWTLGGMLQGDPNMLFGYELADPPAVDAALNMAWPSPGYSIIPYNQLAPFSFTGEISNAGGSSLTDPRLVVEVYDAGSALVWTDTVPAGAIAAAASATVSTSNWAAPTTIEDYTVDAYVITVGQTDGSASNNGVTFAMSVNDTVYARDDGNVTSSLAIGAGNGGYLGQQYKVNSATNLLSVGIYVSEVWAGEELALVVWDMPAAEPGSVICSTDTLIWGPTDSAGYYVLDIASPSGSFPLPVGDFAFTAVEFDSAQRVGTTGTFYLPTVTWINWPTSPLGGWGHNEDFGFERVFIIRPHLEAGPVGMAPSYNGQSVNVKVGPNPSSNGRFHLDIELEKAAAPRIEVCDMQGRVIWSARETDAGVSFSRDIDLGNIASGNYMLKVKAGEVVRATRLAVTR